MKLNMRVATTMALAMAMLGPVPQRAAAAQSTNAPTVSGSGASKVTVQATTLRVSAEISATGKDLATALEALGKRRDTVKAGLAALNPSELTIGPSVVGSAAEASEDMQSAQIRRMIMMQRGSKAVDSTEVKVSAMVKADFALPKDAAEGDATLIAAKALEDKIRAVLKAPAPDKELSAEERERLEEMQAMMQSVSGADGDGITFSYVAPVGEAELTKATTEAFNRARSEAAFLATAAGMKLGAVQSLTTQSDSDFTRAMLVMTRGQSSQTPTTAPREATGTTPGPLTLTITVFAAFALTP